MTNFKTLREKDVLALAMKGQCEIILKAPMQELDRLNEQYSEMLQRRKKILEDEADCPFDVD